MTRTDGTLQSCNENSQFYHSNNKKNTINSELIDHYVIEHELKGLIGNKSYIGTCNCYILKNTGNAPI